MSWQSSDVLAPGHCFAVAFYADQSLGDPLEPEVLEQLRTVRQRFSLKEGETKNLMLKVMKPQ